MHRSDIEDIENDHIIGRLTSNLWVATICEQMWIVDITKLIKGLNITNINIDKVFYEILFFFYQLYVKNLYMYKIVSLLLLLLILLYV